MRRALLSAFSIASLLAQDPRRTASLDRVAHVATVMLDGDLCARIETARSKELAMRKDPRDHWRASDNFDVNDQAFIRCKKTLMRLARLCEEECDVNLWMPEGPQLNRIQIMIRNVHELSQFWPWGALNQPMPTEMKRVFTTGERVTVHSKAGMISVLAPVYDSLGDVVALAEVVSRDRPDPRENVK